MKKDPANRPSATPSPVRPDYQKEGLPTRFPRFFHADPVSRRSVLKFMGASMAMGFGLTGCDRKPVRRIISRVEPPEYMKPGEALYYSSTWTAGPVPYGVIVKTVDGRPVGLEGDPECPNARGRATVEMQAALLGLYDPDRLRAPRHQGVEATWPQADKAIGEALDKAGSVVLLTGPETGPARRRMIEAFCRRFKARHLAYDPLHDEGRRAAWREVYGAPGRPLPQWDKAKVIVSVDADFLGTDGDTLGAARGYASHRKPTAADPGMNRLWHLGGAMTLTALNADHRIRLSPARLALTLVALEKALTPGDGDGLSVVAKRHGLAAKTLRALAKDLRSHPGEALVVAGPHLPAEVHAAVALLNRAIGAEGHTLLWEAERPGQAVAPAGEIAAALAAKPEVLVCLEVNPAYDWPGGGFDKLMAGVGTTVVHALGDNETAALATWALPAAHPLESWDDALVGGSRWALGQPVIAPLWQARQAYESLFRWAYGPRGTTLDGAPVKDWHDYLRAGWPLPATGAEAAWEEVLRRGHLGTLAQAATPKSNPAKARELARRTTLEDKGLQVVFAAHPALRDGRHAANGWLQELPHPVSRIVWDNPIEIAPALARKLNLEEGDLATLAVGGRSLEAPVLIQPGAADEVILVPLGGGRTRAGEVGTGRGVNPAPLRAPDGALVAGGATLAKARGKVPLVRTQKHFSMQGRPLALHADLAEYRRDPHFVKHRRHIPKPVKIHREQDFSKGEKWGMAIDLSACTGCGGCVVACQAENNVPIVGKEQCGLGREMHWMRIDLYRDGDEDDPVFNPQPVNCQHCDNAPCETVCPVLATTHSPDGLNEMTYNRCVGTRYCANNCPYKVRRFNFHNYQKRNLRDPVQELAQNPDVTVRTVGVMEKCSFCIQRINAARFNARNEGRGLQDGEIVPACMQACPSGAILFGDLNDPGSEIARLRKHERSYFLLEEFNTRPALAYLARVRNPHPDLAAPKAAGGHGGH